MLKWELLLIGIGTFSTVFLSHAVVRQKRGLWPLFTFWFVCGICIGILFTFLSRFTFSYEVNLASLLNILLTLSIAFFFQHFLKQKNETRKAEKDVIAIQVTAIGENLRAVQKAFRECYEFKGIDAQKVNAIKFSLRGLSNSIELTEKLFKTAKIDDSGQKILAIKKSYFSYKKALTGKPFPDKPYQTKHFTEQERLFNSLYEQVVFLSMVLTSSD